MTALHWAAKRGDDELAHLILRYGADVDAKDIVRLVLKQLLIFIPLFFSLVAINFPSPNIPFLLINRSIN